MKNKAVVYQVFSFFLLLIVVVLLIDRKPVDKEDKAETISSNQTLEVIKNRKSVRNYTSETIKAEDIDAILKAGMAAPSGKDLRPWEIMVVDQREILDKMAEKLPNAKMLSSAPLAIIVCGNKETSFYWYLDCSAVTQNILLAIESLGLGAVWTAVYPYEDRTNALLEIIDLPENVLPLNIIPVGYPEGEQSSKDKYDVSKIHWNNW